MAVTGRQHPGLGAMARAPLAAIRAALPFALAAMMGATVLPHMAGGAPYAVAWIATSVLTGVAAAWSAAAWHRHVLLGWPVPRVPAGVVVRVALAAVLVGLVMIPAAVILGWAMRQAVGPGADAPPLVTDLCVLAVRVLLVCLLLRLSPVFPAVAVGEPISVALAWRRTAGRSLSLAMVAAGLCTRALASDRIALAMSPRLVVQACWGTLSDTILFMAGIGIATGLFADRAGRMMPGPDRTPSSAPGR